VDNLQIALLHNGLSIAIKPYGTGPLYHFVHDLRDRQLGLDSLKHSHQPKAPDQPNRLANDFRGHFAGSIGPICKDDRYLDNSEVLPPGSEAHFDLEGIPIGANLIEIDSLKHPAAKALESAGRI
jgi:hypothetical protein